MQVTVTTLQSMAQQGQKIAMLTCYDATFAHVEDEAGVDVVLVGDSLGMVIQGHGSTLPVTLEDVEYHTRCVASKLQRAMLVTDLPFGSYQVSPQQAFASAARLMAAGAHMVKLEGGSHMVDTVRFLTERGIPVCAHLGLTPQFVNVFGGYKVQGRNEEAAERVKREALELQAAGAGLLVLEAIPAQLAAEVTAAMQTCPTIGIGAGVDCHGQVLVLQDMLDIFPGKKARFVKNFMQGQPSIQAAVARYVDEVKARQFPAAEHSY
ncbi:3-methyl-2-oxobutanoate hydroxymethyltransferase [Leeia sp.]|uniref:3-methyl-2-oxobutanoate hydroxymethyltransferase n=1 Tax=Leeia sp. TaxID=2884678 RepID=UPI0035AD8606